MGFGNFLGKSSKTGGALKGLHEKGAVGHIERLETAFFQISSALSSHKDPNAILEVIARESLYCLRAHRSSIFLLEPEKEMLQPQSSHALEPRYQQVGIVEEKEAAKKALKQKRPLLLGKSEDFSDFFKYEERENKITSLMSIPLLSRGKGVGVLSAVRINEEYGFDARSLRFFSSFANHASTALEMGGLREEVQKGKTFQNNYERYLDNILNQVQGLSQREQQRIDSHIVILQAEQKVDEKQYLEIKTQEKIPWVKAIIVLRRESGVDRREDEGIEVVVRVEFDEEYWGLTQNSSKGGAFVVSTDPMDLGDKFLLRLPIPDGREAVEVEGKVVWTNKYGKETRDLRRGMAIKFLKLKPEDQNRIEEYIQAFKNNQNLPLQN